MRLLNTTTYRLEEFNDQIPKYAILSHRWDKEETTYKDYRKERDHGRLGYHKVIQACNFARSRSRDWLWVDTCCIDMKSSTELTEFINSMFDWYQEAEECYAYLADVRPPNSNGHDAVESDFCASSWFKCGWTLQGLLAPALVLFCASNWEVIGSKTHSPVQADRGFSSDASLNFRIKEITGIPEDILSKPCLIDRCTVAQKLSWASQRQFRKVEDQSYSLLGLFGVNLPIMYGERSNAFIRLQQEILRTSLDESLLAWNFGLSVPRAGFSAFCSGMLADSPTAFGRANKIELSHVKPNPRFLLASGGLLEYRPDISSKVYEIYPRIYALTLRCAANTQVATLRAGSKRSDLCFTLVLIMRSCGHFERVCHEGNLLGLRSSKIVSEVFYMHASSASRCRILADVKQARSGAE